MIDLLPHTPLCSIMHMGVGWDLQRLFSSGTIFLTIYLKTHRNTLNVSPGNLRGNITLLSYVGQQPCSPHPTKEILRSRREIWDSMRSSLALKCRSIAKLHPISQLRHWRGTLWPRASLPSFKKKSFPIEPKPMTCWLATMSQHRSLMEYVWACQNNSRHGEFFKRQTKTGLRCAFSGTEVKIYGNQDQPPKT